MGGACGDRVKTEKRYSSRKNSHSLARKCYQANDSELRDYFTNGWYKRLVNGWFPAVYMSCMSPNFRLLHVSNLSVRNFRIFLLMYPGSLWISTVSPPPLPTPSQPDITTGSLRPPAVRPIHGHRAARLAELAVVTPARQPASSTTVGPPGGQGAVFGRPSLDFFDTKQIKSQSRSTTSVKLPGPLLHQASDRTPRPPHCWSLTIRCPGVLWLD